MIERRDKPLETSEEGERQGRDRSGRTIKGTLLPRYITKPKGGEAEPHMRKAKATDRAKNPASNAGLLRGMGDGTTEGTAMELERPSLASYPTPPYKEQPKAAGAKRESERDIVPQTRRRRKPSIGKVPCRNRACEGSKDEGLTEKVSFPGREAVSHRKGEKVRELQRALWITAKRGRDRKFPKLYERVTREDVLWEAWRRVKANRGAAGVDGETIDDIERSGVAGFIQVLRTDLKNGEYRPQPVRRRYIPKTDGKRRPLGIPTVRDRVAQMAVKIVIEPIFEADFEECSYGFRPRRSAQEALETLRKAAPKGYEWALEIDIEKYFDTIDQGKLMAMVECRVADRRVLKLIRKWLEAGVLEEGAIRETLEGTPQGGVISPLLANIYLHELDKEWQSECGKVGILVRYADDAVVVCKNGSCAEEARRRITRVMNRLGLRLHPEKTRIVHLRRKGLDFLGCHLRMGASRRYRGRWYLYRWPNGKAMKKVRERIREITAIQRAGRKKLEKVVEELNAILRGWKGYFQTGNATRQFTQVDKYVWRRIVILQNRRRSRNNPTWTREFTYAWYKRLGVHPLTGTIRYPNFVKAG
jgi:RNA-directed DNA polymerase